VKIGVMIVDLRKRKENRLEDNRQKEKSRIPAPKKTDSFETIGLILKLLILLFQ